MEELSHLDDLLCMINTDRTRDKQSKCEISAQSCMQYLAANTNLRQFPLHPAGRQNQPDSREQEQHEKEDQDGHLLSAPAIELKFWINNLG